MTITSAQRWVPPYDAVAGDLSRIRIEPADPAQDLEILVSNLGQRDYFADRLSRQKSNDGVLLIARLGDRLIGDLYLWCEAAEEIEIRKYLPNVPLITHVEILPKFRSRGIGTKLISAAQTTLVDRGHRRVALAVEIGNVRAEKLYTRLGYRRWPHPPVQCHNMFDDEGSPPDICYVMVKDLPG